MKTTRYFREVQPLKHPEVSQAIAFQVAEGYQFEEVQEDGRFRRWSYVEELGHWVRVVVLPDGETVHNAFIDSSFKPTR